EDVEALERDRRLLLRRQLEDLLDPQINALVIAGIRRPARVEQNLVLVDAGSLRIVRDGVPQPGRQRREGADDEVGRQAEDAGQDEAMPLVVRRRMARIVLDRAVVETEQIAANRVRLAERV